MPKYVQREIELIRENAKQQTQDEDSTTSSLSRSLILQFMSEADARIQSRVLGASPNTNIFNATKDIRTVSAQGSYSLPLNIYAGDEVRLVEFSSTGQEKHLRPLERIMRSQIGYDPTSSGVDGYVTEGRNLILSSPPNLSDQLIRLTYTKALDDLDIRRGKIAITPSSSGGEYTTLQLLNDSYLNETNFNDNNFLCVCDRNGVVERYNIEYDSYDSGTQTFNLTAGQLVADGAITAGNFITIGEYTSTHSSLPRICDRYRIAYATWQVATTVSNTDAQAHQQKVMALEDDIVKKLKGTWHGPLDMPISGFYA